MSNETPFQLNLPVNFTPDELYDMLRHAVAQGASDITIQSGDYIWAEIRRRYEPITNRVLEHSELERALAFLYNNSGTAILQNGDALDFEVEISAQKGDPNNVKRFRANATACRVGAIARGVSITLRTIPGVPPPLSVLNLPESIKETIFPEYGLVLIVGTTGSGKSTLLASCNRHRLENADSPVKILTYEEPIEFVYTGLAKNRMPQPSQVAIGRNLKEFSDAGRNAMRRKGGVIIMGESRDRESVQACFEMSMSGHAVYSTVHADTPAEVFARMVSFYPEDAQPAAANKLLDSLRLVVAQKLARTTDDQVTAIRSWFIMDRKAKNVLAKAKYYEWGSIVTQMMDEAGTSFDRQCLPLVREGKISYETFLKVTSMTPYEARQFLTEHDMAELLPAHGQEEIDYA
ncbi:type II/IV secretion system family protein 3 [Pusillimonas sp. T2]|uniref:type IV pilus twitching motility protein PilT n=1 Tax=Pusillimonas sp. T2 TaxID=1548123 RepID=UPI000B8AF6EA|nr:ATPase, T2SS/T4P/T4SS family [Pusillimonas sp. T2]OXR48036.1 type II/IV secretion system family protein 3 [Pusillimonas sp. T2]